MSRLDNPPAFPQGNEWMDAEGNMRLIHEGGMTLRDYTAIHALPSIMHLCAKDTLFPDETIEQSFARKAYQIADAMLAERAQVQA